MPFTILYRCAGIPFEKILTRMLDNRFSHGKLIVLQANITPMPHFDVNHKWQSDLWALLTENF